MGTRIRLSPIPPAPGNSLDRGCALLALLIVLLPFAALPPPARADMLDDQVRAIAKELLCPVCAGQTVADSNAQISVQMRDVIRQKLEAGESRQQIIQYFVDVYGVSILAEPPARGFALGVWVAPIVALLVGLGIVGVVLHGWLRRGDQGGIGDRQASAPSTSDVAPATDDEWLERELARFRHGGAR